MLLAGPVNSSNLRTLHRAEIKRLLMALRAHTLNALICTRTGLLHRIYVHTHVAKGASWLQDGCLGYTIDSRYVVASSTQNMWLCLLPPAASRQRVHKKRILNYKQSVEIGHYGGGMLWMHRVPKSIRELLYLVRRSQGGVIKAVQGMRGINESALCLTGACLF